MAWWDGLLLTAAAVLAISGVAKLRSPEPTQGALRAAHLPSNKAAVMCLAVVEVVLAVAVAGTGSRVGTAAVAYLPCLCRLRDGRSAPR